MNRQSRKGRRGTNTAALSNVKFSDAGLLRKMLQLKLRVLNYWWCSSFSACCLVAPPLRLSSTALALETPLRGVVFALSSVRLIPAEGLALLNSPTTMSLLCPTCRSGLGELSQFDSGLTPSAAAVLVSTCPVIGKL